MKKTTPKADAGQSASTLEQKALAHFSAKRYKEATDLYKDLLKIWDDACYRQQLAQCYLQRALGMSAKGMPKEAIVLWENYAEWATPPLADLDSYILWLLAAKNSPKAFARLEQLTGQQLDEDYPDLAVWLGFMLFSGYAEIAGHLPADSALTSHFGLMQKALDAYRSGETERIDELLKKLPFRSAFRDLRSLLKAQLAGAVSVEQAQTLLSKIPEHSPYRPMADAMLAYTRNGAEFVETALSLEHTQRRIIARAKGLSAKQTELLEALQKLQGNQTDKSRFNLAIQFQALFGIETAQDYCWSLLAVYPAGRKDYLKNFDAIDAFEDNRIQALLCEQGENGYDASYYWRQCIKSLQNSRPESDLKIALILRRLAGSGTKKETVGLLIESLDYDAGDRESFLKILNFYDQIQTDAAEYERWLELSLKRFPQDIEILARAAKSASARKAFKKAAKYAQDLLKIDPVNTVAKQLLFASHLAHARRLIKTRKLHLVEKEIQAAMQMTVNKNLRRQAELMHGFSLLAAEDSKQSLQRVAEALQSLNDDPVNMQFQAFLEASLLDMPVAPLSKALPPLKDHLLSPQQFTRLMELIRHYDEQDISHKILFATLDKIKAPVKKSIQQPCYNEELLLDWCRCLENIGHFDWLKHCVKHAQTKWSNPIWVYYRIYVEIQGDPNQLGMMSMFQLQNASEKARSANDQKTASLINRFIDRVIGDYSPFGSEAEMDYDAEREVNDAIFDDLFGHLPDSIMDKIDRKVQSNMMKTDPDLYVTEHIRSYSQTMDPKRLTELFMNPEFFTAVAVLDAARELQIDVGCRFEDIVYRFENDTPQRSLPFF